VLRHGGLTLPESLVICEYIEDTFAGRALLPADPGSRAWARVWMQFCDGTLIKLLSNIVRASASQQIRQEAIDSVVNEARRLELHVNPRPLWSGQSLSLPDLCYFTFFEALDLTGADAVAQLSAACPRLMQWRNTLFDNPAFAIAHRELATLQEATNGA
jgi:glutathione S-transferase